MFEPTAENHSLPLSLLLMYAFLMSTDDFADEEEVQSFGYKRFGE